MGEKNLVMLCYSKILSSRKVLLIVLTLILSFVVPFLHSLATGKLFHNDFIIRGFLEDWPAFLGIGIFAAPFLSLIFIVYCEKISETLSDIIWERTIEIDDDRYTNLVTHYQSLYNSDLFNLLLILAIFVNLFWIVPNISDNKLSWPQYNVWIWASKIFS